MKKYFATYDQSLALKELGYDEPCFGQFYKHPSQEKEEFRLFKDCVWEDRTTSYWVTNISPNFVSAPTKSQIFEFFREKHGLWFRPDFYDEMKTYDYQGSVHKLGRFSSLASLDNHKTVEELESACIDKMIEITKNK